MKILVPLDRSPLAESILKHIEQLLPHDAELALLHVVPPQPVSLTGVSAVGAYVEEEARLRDLREIVPYMEALADSLRARGFTVRILIDSGNAAQVILRTAESIGADLIAMTTHGRSGLAHLLLGSVAEEVLRSSHIPVLAVKPSQKAS